MVSLSVVGLGVGAATAALAADVNAATGDTFWLEEPRCTSSGQYCWICTDSDPWLEVQQYGMGSVGKLVRTLKCPVTNEQVKDFRLLLKSASGFLELAVSPQRIHLQRAQLMLRRVARAAELGALVDVETLPDIPHATVQFVVNAARQLAACGSGRVAAERQCLLRFDLQLKILSFLVSVDAAPCSSAEVQNAGPDEVAPTVDALSPTNDTALRTKEGGGRGTSLSAARELGRCGAVCSYWDLVAGDDALWSPLLVDLNRKLGLVESDSLRAVLRSPIMTGIMSARDIFVLTCIESRRLEAEDALPGPLAAVDRGLHGLSAQLRPAVEASTRTTTTSCCSGFGVGATTCGGLGFVAVGAPAAVVGGACGLAAGQKLDSAVSGAYVGGLAGGAAGGLLCAAAGGATGAALGGLGGAAAGSARLAEGVGQGGAALAEEAAGALRRAPDAALGGWTSEPGAAGRSEEGADCVDEVYRHNRGITWGLVLGMQSCGYQCVGAVTDVVHEPLRGANEHQAAGAFKGLGRALVGLATKPAAGALDVAGGVLRGTGNRLRQCRECTLVPEVVDELAEARARLGCSLGQKL